MSDAANVMVYVGIPKGQADQEEGEVFSLVLEELFPSKKAVVQMWLVERSL